MRYPLKVQARRKETRYESHKSQTTRRGLPSADLPVYLPLSSGSSCPSPHPLETDPFGTLFLEGVAVSRENNRRPKMFIMRITDDDDGDKEEIIYTLEKISYNISISISRTYLPLI